MRGGNEVRGRRGDGANTAPRAPQTTEWEFQVPQDKIRVYVFGGEGQVLSTLLGKNPA